MKRAQAFIFLFTVLFLFAACAEAQTDANKQPVKEDFRLLAKGANSDVNKPFIFVARDAETYRLLQKLVSDLPNQDEKYFESYAVIAAFAGERPSAGYDVVIGKNNNRIEVKEIKPPKGSMTAQVITSPFAVAAILLNDGEMLEYQKKVTFDTAWMSASELYGISNGSITETGGFAGRKTDIPINGEIRIMRFGEYITSVIEITDSRKSSSLKMKDIASGALRDGGSFKLLRIDPGTLIQQPRPTLNAVGSFKDNMLTLVFESNPINVNDGYEGRGTIKAIKK